MKKTAFAVSFLVISIVLCLVPSVFNVGTAQAYSSKSGIISQNETWTAAGSPYNLTANVLIDSGVTVTVESGAVVNLGSYYIRVNGSLVVQPGVNLNMGSMSSGIQVYGLLDARGTSSNTIRVNGAYGYTVWIAPPSYSYITFYAKSTTANSSQAQTGSVIEHAILNSTYISTACSVTMRDCVFDTAIKVLGGAPLIHHNIIKCGLSIEAGSPTISSNSFDRGFITLGGDDGNIVVVNNVIDASASLYNGACAGISFGGSLYYGTMLVEKNLIKNCFTGIAIFSPNHSTITTMLTVRQNTLTDNQIGISVSNSYQPTVTDNNFESNDINVKMLTGYSGNSKDISIPNNWWGTTDTAVIDQSIVDYYDDFNLGKVTYQPILTHRVSSASPDLNALPPVVEASPTPEAASATSEPTSALPATPTYTPPVESTQPTQTTEPTSASNVQIPTLSMLEWGLIAVVALLGVVSVLLVVNIFYMRRRRQNQ